MPTTQYLTPKQFRPDITPQIAQGIALRYIRAKFVRLDSNKKRLPFCKAKNGLYVEHDSGNIHFLSRQDNATGVRVPEMERYERIHWIIPILTGNTLEHVEWIYWPDRIEVFVPKHAYLIILDPKPASQRLRFNTAYRVTDIGKLRRLYRNCKKKK